MKGPALESLHGSKSGGGVHSLTNKGLGGGMRESGALRWIEFPRVHLGRGSVCAGCARAFVASSGSWRILPT